MAVSFNRRLRSDLNKITGFLFARYFFAKIFIGFVASTIVLAIFLAGAFEKFELVTLDQRFRLRPNLATDDSIVLIEMAEDSIKAIGRWPWSRDWHATLLGILKAHGAGLILFDVIFDKESGASYDRVFAQALKEAGNVYLPFVFQFARGDAAIKGSAKDEIKNVLMPQDEFLDGSKRYGHVNVLPDIDGTIRRTPLFIKHKGRLFPQIAFKAACDRLGVRAEDIVVRSGRDITLKVPGQSDIVIPIDAHNQMLVNWAGRWKDTFTHYSYIDIIVSQRQRLQGRTPRIDLDSLKDKICVIGLAAPGLYDIRPIPYQASYPVVGMNANIMNNILMRDFIKKASRPAEIMTIYLMGLLVALLVSKVRFMRGAAYTIAAVAGYILLCFFVFMVFKRWITLVYPAFAMFFSFLGVAIYHEAVLAFEKKKYFDLSITDGLTRLFNIRHFKDMMEGEFNACVGRKSRKLSIIMADVDHFKNFNDTYGHQVGDFVLKCFAQMFKDSSRGQDVVARYGGEEFIMMLPGTDLEDAKIIAERIREAIEQTPLKRHNESYSITVSLGVAMLTKEKTIDELIKKADDALYQAKRDGRNRVCVGPS
jgi:diguanylate cyclase (GGDEF)-like protein